MEIENLCDEKALPGDDNETSEYPKDDKLNGRGHDFSEYEIGFVSGLLACGYQPKKTYFYIFNYF